MSNTDVVIIGSGVGGLCCGALLARYGYGVTVCESHSLPGGAAHSFERNGFKFDSGPSLYSGLSYSPSANPLRQVLDAIGEDLNWVNYNSWGCYLPEGNFDAEVGSKQFEEVLLKLRGEEAVKQWRQLLKAIAPLSYAVMTVPTASLRSDLGAILTVGKFAPALLPYLGNAWQLTGAFDQVIKGIVKDTFIYNWLNLLCFLLSGLPMEQTSAAEVAFMFADWYRPQVALDYPLGGSGAIIDALVRGLGKYGGKLQLSAHVSEIIVENRRAVGVKLKNGTIIKAKTAVISNASTWDTLDLIPPTALPPSYRHQRASTPACDSFMHLHLGINAAGLSSDLGCHYVVLKDWQITAPQNLVAISIPSVLDPALAPPGKHVIHVYTPATEPYQLWANLERSSTTYQKLKQERSEVMWQALEKIIPDIRARCEVTLIGTPLTHARFLRRYRGSYGPSLKAGKESFPGPYTPVSGLLCCGDSTFPGIGIPAVAASGMIAANSLAPVTKHLALLRDIGY
ncbi:NAD(P)/FAD-dependent oxidoreductase [Gloeocapsa sp. PCC 73106]|uniref:phytoene desaturase family protein n=1 Tax=Gloeocapsa sp. PCC 73106 TaxID=102232 RepID=UPI0002ACBECF|nr:NAD(P)/FAD-dependent oxidoreductase [Gloeocapsa sp. PCC 73106]ELR98164.1 phytoene dehydrogenase-like oxidoreductase [Gloeocapsa sp. PCC 73106]